MLEKWVGLKEAADGLGSKPWLSCEGFLAK